MIELIEKIKHCPQCDKNLNITCFGKYKNTKDGLYYCCKECVKKNNRKRHEKRYIDFKKNKKEHEVFKKQLRENYYNAKDRNYQKLWSSGVIRGHSNKGYKLNFSKDELETLALNTKNCMFCDIPLSWYRKGKVRFDSPSLDNLNLKYELNIEDIAIICHLCNATKNKRTFQEFVNYCQKMSSLDKEAILNNNHYKLKKDNLINLKIVGDKNAIQQ